MPSRKSNNTTHFESGPNMTPLVDVVMVILIFLMLAGSFGVREHYMASTFSPVVERSQAAVNGATPDRINVELVINSEGGVRVPWRASAITDNADLAGSLSETLRQIEADSGRKPDEVQLLIRAGDGVTWDKVAPVYDAALRAKFEKIGFARP